MADGRAPGGAMNHIAMEQIAAEMGDAVDLWLQVSRLLIYQAPACSTDLMTYQAPACFTDLLQAAVASQGETVRANAIRDAGGQTTWFGARFVCVVSIVVSVRAHRSRWGAA